MTRHGSRKRSTSIQVALVAFLATERVTFGVAPEVEAEALIREALDLRRAGNDARAYPLLRKAYEAAPTARTAAQLGLVEMQLGYWVPAEEHLSESLSTRPGSHPWVDRNRSILEESLARVRLAVGEISVSGGPPGAELLVNGKAAGRLPLDRPVRLGEGTARLELRADGYVPFLRTVPVAGGQRQQVEVVMTAVPPTPGERVSQQNTREQLARVARPAAWVTAATATAVLGLAVHQTWLRIDKKNEFDEHISSNAPGPEGERRPDCGVADPGRGGPGCSAIYEAMQDAKMLALIGYVTSGVLASASVALFVLSKRSNEASVKWACAPSFGVRGGSCHIEF